MTTTDSQYFFKSFDYNSADIGLFDIKAYLYALGSKYTSLIEKYRLKYGCIEEEYVAEWLEALVPYFKSNKSVESLKLSTQNQLYLEQRNDVNELNYLEESEENWIGESRVLEAFLECLKRINEFSCIQSHLNKIFPMICQVVDDYRAEFKIIGIELINEFLRIVPAEVVIKYNLQVVLYESLKINITFESDDLVEGSINTWISIVRKVEMFPGKEFLKRCDELLLLLCRDVGITSKLGRKILLLKGIGMTVELMQYSSIRYLRKIVVIVNEVVREDFTSDQVVEAGQDAMANVIRNCWIRLNSEELLEMIRDTFGGCEKIEKLLEAVDKQRDINNKGN